MPARSPEPSAAPRPPHPPGADRQPTIHGAFDAVATHCPGVVAIEGPQRTLSYAELAAESRRLAARLEAAGVARGDVVGVCVGRSPEFVVAILAILRRGAAYAPLPTDYPIPRLCGMVADSRMRVLVADRAGTALVARLRQDGAVLEEVSVAAAAAAEGEAPAGGAEGVAVGPDDPAYVMFTSGSTGRPKGVVVPHRAVVGLVTGQSYVDFGPDLRTLLLAPTAFDASTFEIWAPLLHGGTVVVFPDADFAPTRLGEVLRAGRVNCLFLTTALFNLVVGLDPGALATVAHLLTGGEMISMAHVRRAFAALSGVRITHCYGPTETTTFACTQAIDPEDPFPDGTIPIGGPLAHADCIVVDGRGEPVTDGTPGELWIGGSGVALGYLSGDEGRFVADPRPGRGGERMYRSGDLVRRRPDGALLFLGRIDRQVKIRGHRVEPAEIEATITSHPEVRDAAVLPFQRDDGTALAAFMVRADGVVAPIGGLRAWLAERLPAPMLPARLVTVMALPVTVNGKLDREALLARLEPETESRGSPACPDTEAPLASLWRDLLGGRPPSRDDDFFDLGGDSLSAIRLVTRIERETGVRLPVRVVFEHPRLADIAAAIEAARPAGPVPRATPAGEDRDPIEFPALPAPRGMWALHDHLPDRATYNQPFAFRLGAEVDPEAIRTTLAAVMARHPALRSAIVASPGGPIQRVTPAGTARLSWGVEPAVGPEGIDAALRAHARRPFDLAAAPLWRATFFPAAAPHGVLLIVFHHVIVDDWSVGLFLEEIAALSGGAPAPPPASACRLEPPDAARRALLLRYWQGELADVPPATRLPGARAAAGAGMPGTTRRRILPGLAVGLGQAARATRSTAAQWLVGVFHAWLGRVTVAPDVVVATPLSLRGAGIAEDAFGCCLNTVPIRVRSSDDDDARHAAGTTLAELVARVRRTMIGAGDHAALPYDEIVAATGRHGRQGAALADILVVVTEGGLKRGRFGAAALEPLPCDTATAKFGATFFFDTRGDDVELAVEYATNVYDDALVAVHLDTLATFLEGAIRDPAASIDTLPLAERGLVGGNAPVPARSGLRPIHAAAIGHARSTPDLPAVIAGTESLSFAALDAASRALAARLAELGCAREERVGICLPRGASSCVAILAVLRAGAVCVPLDPALPPERLARMVAIAGVRLVVGAESTDAILGALGGIVPVPACGHPPAPGFVDPDVALDDLAYVLFTSGSTGDPKGVEMPHGPLAALFDWQQRSTPRAPGDRTLHFASTGFDAAFQEIFAAWEAGCTVVVADEEVRRDPARLVAIVTRERIDRAILPTAMLVPFAEAVLAAGVIPTLLRDVIVAGERLHVTDTVRRLFAALPACRLWNHYGPTESHVVTAHLLAGPPAAWPDHPPIGLPIDGADVWIAGPAGVRLPAGCVGEIILGGGCLARGYASRPDLTAERFPVETGPAAGTRTYRTGDLGWIGPDGTIECLGRNDRQIKISGHRIEPGEVESALAACPGVRRAAVIVRRDGAAVRLVGFLEVDSDWPGARVTRDRLRATLSEPMVPALLVPLGSLPGNVNGKIDRQRLAALPIETGDDGPTSADREPPRGPVETTVAEEWSRILGISRVSREDDFFALGGHSLPAMMLVAAIDGRCGVRIPVRTVFERPRLADLAAAVADRLASNGGTGAGGMADPPRAVDAGAAPALPAQRGMWLLQEILPDPAAYNQPVALRPTGPVDWHAFRLLLVSAMNRHPALRASLVVEDGVLMERHVAVGELALPWSVEPGVGPVAIDGALRDHARQPFDLSRAPLWRAVLFPDAAPHGVLLLLFHHAIVDDWSIRTLLGEFAAGHPADAAASLPPAPPAPPAAPEDRAWWSRVLEGAPAAIAWPGRGTPPEAPTGRGAVVRFAIPAEIVTAWQRVARDADATLFHAWLGATHVWLQRVAACGDSVVLTPVATRTAAALQSVVGCHLNTLPTRLQRPSAGATAAALTATVRASFLDSLDRGGLPFDEIVAAVPGSSGKGMQPLANVMFVLLDDRHVDRRIGTVAVEQVPLHTGTARFDLTLAVSLVPDGGAEVCVEYALDALDEARVRAMAGRLVRLLEAVAADPLVDLDALDLLDEGERRLLLGAFAGHPGGPGEPTTLHGLVGTRPPQAPDALAILDGDRAWSREALERRARGIADRLRGVGAGPGTRVGVTVRRSAEYVAVVLGVLRTGAAWVPLDVAAAPARAEFIAADAGLVAVVTEGPAGIPLPPSVALVDVAGGWPAAGSPAASAEVVVDPSAPAYLLYTSGSTGKPKGVVVSHAAAVAFVRAMQARYPLAADDRFLFATGTTFDISVYEVFGALAAGATIVVAPAGIPDPAAIADLMVGAGVTVAQFVPSFLDLLLERGEFTGSGVLRRVVSGGEALSASLAKRFHRVCGAELVNGYGPTEATVYVTTWTCPRGEASAAPPIGRPLDGVRARILDVAMRPVPVGVPGELFVGGVQLADGYHGRADLTGDRFLADPYGIPGERLYRTGDLCRWREDGNIEFLGRLDHQVKIRGHRIEPGEVESEIERIECGSRAVVVAREDRPGRKRLVAYVAGGGEWDEASLRRRLEARLEAAAVPARIVRLEAFPLTPTGKIDRGALPAPHDQGDRERAAEPPQGPTEAAIAAIWSEVIGCGVVGRGDRFFDLGGNSLLAMRMVGAVERAVGVRVPIRAVFVAPRLADFAAAIATAEASVRRQTPRGTPGEGEAIRGADSGSAAGSDGLRSLVPLQPLGDRTPLVFCHGAGGGLSHFLPSVGKLAPDIPVWGILARDFEGGSAGEAAMHDLVTGYADEIERFRPWGAVNLGGLSLGGWFAWEVAVELRRRGREIGTVILLDTHPRARLPWKMRLRLVAPRIATFVERNLVWAGKLARGHLPRVVRRGLRRVGVPLAALPPQEDALPVDRMVSLVERHLTGPSPVRVDLVRALHPSRVIVPHWRLLAGDGLRVHPFRSPHHHIHLPENADALAALIRSIVDDVEADARGGRRLEKDCSTGCPSSPPSSAPTPAVRPPG